MGSDVKHDGADIEECWLSTTCPKHPKAAHLRGVRACFYCLQTHCGKLHKQFSSETAYTLKTEEAGSNSGVTQVVFFYLKMSSN